MQITRRPNLWLSTSSVLLGLAVAYLAPAQSRNDAETEAFTAARLTEWPTGNWSTNGGNLLNQRYSPLDELNRQTVGGLKAVS